MGANVLGGDSMQSVHDHGIDALKILSMFMVVVLHVLGLGGVLERAEPLSGTYCAAWLLECGAYCAVNCFAMCSGYVSVGRRVKAGNLLKLWLQAAFYTILITAVMSAVKPERYLNAAYWLKAVFPVTTKQYWYFTAYFGLFFLMPLLNAAMERMSRGVCFILTGAAAVVFALIPSAARTDTFSLSEGYSTMWVVLMYLVGGAIKRGNLFETKRRWIWAVAFAASVFVTWGSKIAAEAVLLKMSGQFRTVNVLVRYTSPSVVVSAAALIKLFGGMEIRSTRKVRLIEKLSPLCFGVYLIHVSPIMIELYYGQLGFMAELGTVLMVPSVILTAAAVYLACSGADAVRRMLFSAVGADRLCRSLTTWTENFMRRPDGVK